MVSTFLPYYFFNVLCSPCFVLWKLTSCLVFPDLLSSPKCLACFSWHHQGLSCLSDRVLSFHPPLWRGCRQRNRRKIKRVSVKLWSVSVCFVLSVCSERSFEENSWVPELPLKKSKQFVALPVIPTLQSKDGEGESENLPLSSKDILKEIMATQRLY